MFHCGFADWVGPGVFVCMQHVSIYVCMHVCMYVCMYVYRYVCVYIYIRCDVCVCTYIYIYI